MGAIAGVSSHLSGHHHHSQPEHEVSMGLSEENSSWWWHGNLAERVGLPANAKGSQTVPPLQRPQGVIAVTGASPQIPATSSK